MVENNLGGKVANSVSLWFPESKCLAPSKKNLHLPLTLSFVFFGHTNNLALNYSYMHAY